MLPSMRSAQVLYSLYTATAALAAPVLPRLAALTRSHDQAVTDSSFSQPIGYQPPVTVTIEGSRTIVLGSDHHRLALEGEGEEDDVDSAQVAIDNRPLVPSSSQNTQQPTLAVLSSARPLTTDHLQALSRLQSEQTQSQQETARPEPSRQLEMLVGSLVAPESSPADGARQAQDAVAHMGDSLAAKPYHGSSCASQHAEALVMVMVLIFMLVVLLVGMWEPLSRTSVRPNSRSEGARLLTLGNRVWRLLGREGAISLREDKKTVGRRTSSFRDPDLEIPETTKEQGGEQGWDSDEDEESGAEPWVL